MQLILSEQSELSKARSDYRTDSFRLFNLIKFLTKCETDAGKKHIYQHLIIRIVISIYYKNYAGDMTECLECLFDNDRDQNNFG